MKDINETIIQWPSGHGQPAWPLISTQVRAMVPLLLVGTNQALLLIMARHAVQELPPMNEEEERLVASIRESAGLDNLHPWQRPFRAPHYTCSRAAIFGHRYLPGELGLALHGVLVLDQVLEFRDRLVSDIIFHSRAHPGAMIIGTTPPPDGPIARGRMAHVASFFGLVLNIA